MDRNQKEGILTALVNYISGVTSSNLDGLREDVHAKQQVITGKGSFIYETILYRTPGFKATPPYNKLDASLVPLFKEYLAKVAAQESDIKPMTTFIKNALAKSETYGDLKALLPPVLHKTVDEHESYNSTFKTGKLVTITPQAVMLFQQINKPYLDKLKELTLHKLLTGEE